MRWTLRETEDLVLLVHGTQQADLVKPVLRSTLDRLNYAEYHYHEAKDLFDAYVAGNLAEVETMLLVMWGDEVDMSKFNEFLFKVGAHVLACVQSIHAVGDILAYAVYLSTGMNLRPTKKGGDRVYLHDVARRLASDPAARELQALLQGLIDSADHTHIRALSNLGKHQTIIRPSLNESQAESGSARYSLRFSTCTNHGRTYPPVQVMELLQKSYNPCSRVVVDVGNALNRYLQGMASPGVP